MATDELIPDPLGRKANLAILKPTPCRNARRTHKVGMLTLPQALETCATLVAVMGLVCVSAYVLRLDFTEAPRCLIGCSSIHGEGLFAGAQFKPGDLVADYRHTFQKWNRVPYTELLTLHAAHDLCWFVGESEEYMRIAAGNSAFMRANHSRTPSTHWSPEKRVLVATRVIRVGDEVTYDYRLECGPSWMKNAPPHWA
jgi:hypothetical protein